MQIVSQLVRAEHPVCQIAAICKDGLLPSLPQGGVREGAARAGEAGDTFTQCRYQALGRHSPANSRRIGGWGIAHPPSNHAV